MNNKEHKVECKFIKKELSFNNIECFEFSLIEKNNYYFLISVDIFKNFCQNNAPKINNLYYFIIPQFLNLEESFRIDFKTKKKNFFILNRNTFKKTLMKIKDNNEVIYSTEIYTKKQNSRILIKMIFLISPFLLLFLLSMLIIKWIQKKSKNKIYE